MLADLLGRGETVRRFEVVEPSLEALFIELVGRPPDDEPPATVVETPSIEAAASSARAGDPA